MSIPLAITPMVSGKAPSCAAPSIPRARPETTVNPASASPAAKSRASFTAAALALRAPTNATHGTEASASVPPAGKDRRRGIEFCQQGWIIRLVVEQITCACLAHGENLALDRFCQGRTIRPPAPAREIGQSIQRRRRRAKAGDQLAVAHRADIGRNAAAGCAQRPLPG